MSDELNQIVDNLRKPAVWIRIVFMVAFAVVLYLIIAPVILVVIMAQILFVFIAALVEYIFQILKFLIYATDNKPFPFSNFPSVQDDKFNINNEPEIKKDTKVMTGEESEEKDEDVEVEIKLAKKTAVKKRPKKK